MVRYDALSIINVEYFTIQIRAIIATNIILCIEHLNLFASSVTESSDVSHVTAHHDFCSRDSIRPHGAELSFYPRRYLVH